MSEKRIAKVYSDRTGYISGYLEVTGYAYTRGCHAHWYAKCRCGNTTILSTGNFGRTLSCGCNRYPIGNKHQSFKGYGEIPKCYWSNVLRGAKTRNLELNVTIEDIWDLFLKQNRKCALTNLEIGFGSRHKTGKSDSTASLDRIDSTKGYTIDNIQWVHKDVNRMKQHFDEKYFIGLCNKVSNNIGKRNGKQRFVRSAISNTD
jgi:hypothetical protein